MPMRATVDSNVLVYAELEPESARGIRATIAIQAAAPRGILAIQALAEFLAVVRRRRPESLASGFAKVNAWSDTFETAPTTALVLAAASELIVSHQFQVWDAVIWSAARMAGANIFLSEDLNDGLRLDGMRVVDPFKLTEPALHELLGSR